MHQEISKGPAYGPASLKIMNSKKLQRENIACLTVLEIVSDNIENFYYSARKYLIQMRQGYLLTKFTCNLLDVWCCINNDYIWLRRLSSNIAF